MGILQRLGIRQRGEGSGVQKLGIASPWQEGSLNQILLSDLLGADVADALPLSRDDAMSVPSIAKARNLLVSTAARFPLVALDKSGPLDDKRQPSFLYRTDSDVGPVERMVWTVDDGFFHGLALWLVDRGSEDRAGRRPILNAEYCPYSKWTTQDGKILVNDKPVQAEDIILFNFWNAGILHEGSRTIRAGRDLENSVAGRVRNPVPMTELRVVDDTNLDQLEAQEYVKSWSLARRNPDGAVALTPQGMELHTHGEVDPALFIDARNAIRTDVGSFSNIRASMLDGTAGVDSLTYSTTEGERNAFYDIDLPFWTGPIEERLSMDDVVPRGQRVRFDRYDAYTSATPSPTGPPVKD